MSLEDELNVVIAGGINRIGNIDTISQEINKLQMEMEGSDFDKAESDRKPYNVNNISLDDSINGQRRNISTAALPLGSRKDFANT